MMIEQKRLAPLEREWEEIEQRYRIAQYNAPLNMDEERRKVCEAFRQQRVYHPQFCYQEPSAFPVRQIREFRAKLRPDESPLEQLYDEKARNELLAIEATLTHAPEVITASSCLVNGLPNNALLAEAWKILEKKPSQEDAEPHDISAEQAASQMQTVIEQVGLIGWKALVFSPMSASMSVNRLDKELRIRKGALHSTHDLQRLRVHEIGVHILRYENGVRQPIRLFSNSFPGYAATEEGLAVYSEYRAGVLKTETLRKYAGRVVAANMALSHPFFDVFQVLAQHLDLEMAFEIVMRAKRGFTDTSQPGAHVKDLVYLKGFLEVKAHLEQQPEDYPLLFAGKFGIQHLPLVRRLFEGQSISSPAFLPDILVKL